MTTLTASQMLTAGHVRHESRQGPLRALVARMADAVRKSADRRRLQDMPDHLLRDIGLTRGDIDAL
jgi:uncharacterized protein YjiS (DUF1127 family)